MTENWAEKFASNMTEPSTEKVLALDINRVEPNPFQPRRDISEDKIDELAQSIKSCGLIQPVIVRRVDNGYQLVVGERRLRACKKLGWEKISATIKLLSDNEMATIALIENLQRENLNYFEEAVGYTALMEKLKITQEVLANRLGKSQSTIANKIRLLKLSEEVRQLVTRNNLSERHARALLKIESEDLQKKTIHEISESNLTVKQAEKNIERITGKETRPKKAKPKKAIVKDMRIFLNTIRGAVKIIEKSGLTPEIEETIDPDYVEVRIRLTKEMIKSK